MPHTAGWYTRVPLYFTEHAFSNLDAKRFRSRMACKGDFTVTLAISLGKAVWLAGSRGDASGARSLLGLAPPSAGPGAAINAFRV
ncbi:MAG: hypothetical protein LBW85_14320 [Deltaproteobacteria bacterium]|nr:hypothetical protein [Deltaproteobacteria bacterium]